MTEGLEAEVQRLLCSTLDTCLRHAEGRTSTQAVFLETWEGVQIQHEFLQLGQEQSELGK